jgi:hypothetical protein
MMKVSKKRSLEMLVSEAMGGPIDTRAADAVGLGSILSVKYVPWALTGGTRGAGARSRSADQT